MTIKTAAGVTFAAACVMSIAGTPGAKAQTSYARKLTRAVRHPIGRKARLDRSAGPMRPNHPEPVSAIRTK